MEVIKKSGGGWGGREDINMWREKRERDEKQKKFTTPSLFLFIPTSTPSANSTKKIDSSSRAKCRTGSGLSPFWSISLRGGRKVLLMRRSPIHVVGGTVSCRFRWNLICRVGPGIFIMIIMKTEKLYISKYIFRVQYQIELTLKVFMSLILKYN